MLSRRESEVMGAVFELCAGKGSCLVSPYDLLGALPSRRRYTAERLDAILHSLEQDGCFDLISSDRKGEKVYVITLRPNGRAFRRSGVQMRRAVAFRIALSVAGAVVTFVVGLILRAAFS